MRKVQSPNYFIDFEGFNQCLLQQCLLEDLADVTTGVESTLEDLLWAVMMPQGLDCYSLMCLIWIENVSVVSHSYAAKRQSIIALV